MGDSRIEKGEIADFARRLIREELHPFAEAAGQRQAELERRIFSLGLAFDCLVTVLEKHFSAGLQEGYSVNITGALKSEIDRRHKEAAERKAKQENKPLVSVP